MTDDELLSAFLDGALTDAEMELVEARLADDSVFAARLDRLARTDAAIHAAFDVQLDAPVPAYLTAIVAGAPVASNDNSRRWWMGGGAVAASVLAIMVGFGSVTNVDTPDPAMTAALNSTPSGKFATLAEGKKLTPLVSFASNQGGYCRQFTVAEGNRVTAGLACREKAGWVIKKMGKNMSNADAGAQEYRTAGGHDAVDTAASVLRAGDPLSPSDEAALITRDWNR